MTPRIEPLAQNRSLIFLAVVAIHVDIPAQRSRTASAGRFPQTGLAQRSSNTATRHTLLGAEGQLVIWTKLRNTPMDAKVAGRTPIVGVVPVAKASCCPGTRHESADIPVRRPGCGPNTGLARRSPSLLHAHFLLRSAPFLHAGRGTNYTSPSNGRPAFRQNCEW